MLSEEGAVFVGYTPDYEQFQGTRERLQQMAEAAGYSKHIEQIIPDRLGHPVFEVFRFRSRTP
jgi:hypothetical protein